MLISSWRLPALTLAAAVAATAVLSAVPAAALAVPTVTTHQLASGSYPYIGTFDKAGNFYTANEGDKTISKTAVDGTVTTGWAATPSIVSSSIAIDAAGNVYVADMGSSGKIAKVAPDGTVNESWSALPASSGTQGLVIDSAGNVYASALNTGKVYRVTPDGTATMRADTGSGSQPFGMLVDGADNVYVANMGNDKITKIAADGTVTSAWATLAAGSEPQTLVADSDGDMYSVNWGNATVSKITPAGTVTEAWASLPPGGKSGAIAVDSHDNVYVPGYMNQNVVKISPAGVMDSSWATLPANTYATSIIFSAADDAWISNDYPTSTVSVVPADPAAPAAPTGLTVTPGAESLGLAFTAPRNIGHSPILRYEVSLNGGADWATLDTAGSNGELTATLDGLTADTLYTVQVRAVNAIDDGPVVSGSGTPRAVPAAPTVLGTPGSTSTGKITFSGEAGATFQCAVDKDLQVATVEDPFWSTCTSPLTLTGLATGPHKVHIRQINTFGDHSVPATVQWTVADAPVVEPPADPSVVTAPVVVTAMAGDTLMVGCKLSTGKINQCDITLTAPRSAIKAATKFAKATRSGSASGAAEQVVIGTGSKTFPGAQASGTVAVPVKLNKAGQILARKGGRVTVRAAIHPVGSNKILHSITATRLVRPKIMVISGALTFDPTSARLKPAGRKYLNKLRKQLNAVKTIRCTGHTDSHGAAAYNKALGKARAKAVCKYLTRGTGIKYAVRSHGESKPRATNATAQGRALNRRTELNITYKS